MKLDWQKVNWFSKLLALGLLLYILGMAFIFGMSYQQSISEMFMASMRVSTLSNANKVSTPQSNTQDWQTYRNDEYRFDLQIPSSVKAGLSAPNSVLSTSETKVGGFYVGNMVFVVGDSSERRRAIEERVSSFRQAAKGAFLNDEGPGWACDMLQLRNKQTVIDIFDCGGEGGPAFYALIYGQRYDIFVDGYSSGFNRDLAEQAGHWGSNEDILISLRTFTWIN